MSPNTFSILGRSIGQHPPLVISKIKSISAWCCCWSFFAAFLIYQGVFDLLVSPSPHARDSHVVFDSPGGTRARNIYLDLGANWGQTLDLFPDICRAANLSFAGEQYEVFSFEASPYIAPFVEQLTYAKNRGLKEPSTAFPSSGSSWDLIRMNKEQGSPCPGEMQALRKCYLDKYRDTFDSLKPDQALNSSTLVSSRLQLGSAGGKQHHMKYTFIPAAVSDKESWLEIRQSKLGLLIGGVTTAGKDTNHGKLGNDYLPTVYVRTVNLMKWLESNFKQKDRIVVKMDIEGAEHAVIQNLIKTGTHKLLDVIAWECHAKGGDCNFLRKAMQQLTDIKVLEEGKDYVGWKQ